MSILLFCFLLLKLGVQLIYDTFPSMFDVRYSDDDHRGTDDDTDFRKWSVKTY